MQIIIDISKELKNEIHNHGLFLCPNDKTALINAIKHGVPRETVTEFADRCSECGKMRTGHWIEKMDACECPYCHKAWDYCDNDTEDFDYCPKCGAKLSEIPTGSESNRTCHTCKHYTSGEYDGSCGSYICEHYSNWERSKE